MKNLLACVNTAKTNELKNLVARRTKEFKSLGNKDSEELFKELAFCILTANFTAERSMKIQESVGNGFLTLSEEKLAKRLRELGHRFPNTRAKYIVEARKHAKDLKKIVHSTFDNVDALREWLADNVKGLGYKESSHFLRNIGFEDVAIIDFHIIDFLAKFDMIKKPKTIARKNYLEIEAVLKKIAKAMDVNLAELDLYLWYCETGRVLK
jgi:N-glycosylase/DNA lyase